MSVIGWRLHGDGRRVAPGEVVGPDERLTWPRTIGIGLQHIVAMFGATFLVPLLTGFSLAFARSVGEFGSVYFIAGNMPYKTEIAPLLITIRLEEYDYNGAVAIAALLLVASFVCLLVINLIPLLFEKKGKRNG